MNLSIVIPVFNEEETLAYSFERLIKALQTPFLDEARVTGVEIVFVNDGSKDKTPWLLEELRASRETAKLKIKNLHFSRNFGHSSAVLAGLEEASGDVIAIIDADLQDPPELLGPMVEELGKGYDVVYGQRLQREKESVFKRLTAWGFYRTLNLLTGFPIPNDTGDFRVMKREVLESLLRCGEPDPFLRGLVAWVGYRQKAYPYVRESRKFGSTKYPFKKMLKFALHAILNFSVTPLRLAIYFAFITFVGCLVLIAWALKVHFDGHTVPGWTSMLVAFLLGQSMSLLVMGVIGLYIGQIHIGVQGRPRYIVRKSAPVSR